VRAEQVLRWTGLLAWAGVSLTLLSLNGLTPTRIVLRSVVLLSFAASFLWVTGPGLAGGRPRTVIGLLVWQSLLGTVSYADLAYILALELPFVIRRRTAILWMIVRNLLAIPVFVWSIVNARHAAGLPVTAWSTTIPIVTHLAWQLLAFAIGLVVTSERSQRAELARANHQLRAAHALLADRARLEERIEIARELHDSLGHHLAALNVQLELARQLAHGTARVPIDQAHAAGRRLLGEVREVVSAWRGEAELDLVGALDQLAHAIRDPAIIIDIADDLAITDPAVARAVFRCAQEAVTNAVRHAGARHVWIELATADGGVRLAVRDDGRGQAAIVEGNGLRGIHERAAALHGHMRAHAAPGHGFTVELWLPHPELRA
jgi:signal transduction histidine kinase